MYKRRSDRSIADEAIQFLTEFKSVRRLEKKRALVYKARSRTQLLLKRSWRKEVVK